MMCCLSFGPRSTWCWKCVCFNHMPFGARNSHSVHILQQCGAMATITCDIPDTNCRRMTNISRFTEAFHFLSRDSRFSFFCIYRTEALSFVCICFSSHLVFPLAVCSAWIVYRFVLHVAKTNRICRMLFTLRPLVSKFSFYGWNQPIPQRLIFGFRDFRASAMQWSSKILCSQLMKAVPKVVVECKLLWHF